MYVIFNSNAGNSTGAADVSLVWNKTVKTGCKIASVNTLNIDCKITYKIYCGASKPKGPAYESTRRYVFIQFENSINAKAK